MILKLFFRMKANLACKYKNVNTFSTLNVLRSIKRKEWPLRRTLIVIIKLYLFGWDLEFISILSRKTKFKKQKHIYINTLLNINYCYITFYIYIFIFLFT